MNNIITKCVGLLLITTAHMISIGSSRVEVTGFLGSNVTLHFMFNNTVLHHNSHFAVYISGQRKIVECSKNKACPKGVVDIHPRNTSVLYHITNLRLNQTEVYWASLFDAGVLTESNKVQLIVRQENRSSTVPPLPTSTMMESSGSSNFLFPHIIVVLVVLLVVLLAATLPWFIWSLVKSNDKQQQQAQRQSSNYTTHQERAEVPPPSLVYSVLDFTKRPAVLEMNPNDTEYAAVIYLHEKRV